MYEDLLTALHYLTQHKNDPQVNMFNIVRVAGDCADAITEMNEALARMTAERDQYRNDSINLSILLLCGGGQRGADVRTSRPQTRRLIPAKE